MFVLIVNIDDYEDGTYLQTKRATYKEIRTWVKKHYGIHVSNLNISQTKRRCGLAKMGSMDTEGHSSPELRPEKEAAIREAFLWFGILKKESIM